MSWTATQFLALAALARQNLETSRGVGYYRAMCLCASALISGDYQA